MSASWLLLILLVSMCGGQCPESCTCMVSIKGNTTPPHAAYCSEVPNGPMPSNIAFLKINALLPTVTRQLMYKVGHHVQSLDMSGCNISTIEPGAFQDLTSLMTLRLSRNHIRTVDPDMFGDNSSIKALHLDKNSLTGCGETRFDKLANLLELHLQRNSLSCVPNMLPSKLRVLDVSENNMAHNVTLLYEKSLRHLRLCGNPYTTLEMNGSGVLSLESVCLGDHLTMLPEDMASKLPSLHNLSLIAAPGVNATLEERALSEISHMTSLDMLIIVHYNMDSLYFLHNLTKLKILRLQYMAIAPDVNVTTLFSDMPHLSRLHLDGSGALARAILASPEATFSLRELHYLGLRDTGIQYYLPFHVPYRSFFVLDVSDNPLHCDCKLVDLQLALDSELEHHLYRPERTLCDQPADAHAQPVLHYMSQLQCPRQYAHSDSNPLRKENPPLKSSSDHTTLYVTLGVLVGILAVAGLSLGVVYRIYRQRNRVRPGDDTQEPTLRQLQQARSDDALLTN